MIDADRLLMELHAVLRNAGSISFVTGTYKDQLVRRIEERLSAPPEALRTPRHPSDKWKLWRNCRPMELEPYYCYWVEHLTSEDLHAKSDIATVLALLHQQRDDLDDDARRLHREKMDALYGPDGMPRTTVSPLARRPEEKS